MFALFRRHSRKISIFLTLNMLVSLLPPQASALTSGPSQPETQQFAPAGMDNMVDPFTGDFSYNIPLMDVGGYPININYAAGITPDQEASWVGLGWNLNVGAVNRSVRGIPDDFAGEEIKTEYRVKPNQTFGLTFSPPAGGKELGTFKLGLGNNFNLFYNTYNGFGFSYSLSPSFDLPLMNKKDSPYSLGLNGSLNIGVGSEDGVGITPRIGLSTKHKANNTESTLGASIGFPYSSREGAKGMSLGVSFSQTTSHSVTTIKDSKSYTERLGSHNSSLNKSSFKGFATPSYTTHIDHDMYTVNATLSVTPERLKNVLQDQTLFVLGGYYNGQFARADEDRNPAYGYMYEGLTNDPAAILDFNREKDNGYNEHTTNMPVTSHTYDVFSVQGEGVSGTYRPFRTGVGIVGDNESNSDVISPDLAISGGFTAVDIATLTDVKLGIDFKYVQSNASAGRWRHSGVQQQNSPYDSDNSDVQNVYFSKIGDMTPENEPDYYKYAMLSDDVYEYRVVNGALTGEYQKKDKVTNGLFPKYADNQSFRYREARRNRTSSFNWLTASQADQYAFDTIYSYGAISPTSDPQKSDFQKYSKTEIKRLTEKGRKDHHISEVRITNESGSRYIYGIPVYNTEQEDVTFSVKTESTTIQAIRESGLVDYNPSTDASLNNRNGLEQYYKRTTLQPYATSFLLTYILSSDYVDSDNIPGPSDGDLGTYVKFNYTKTSGDYKWRTPFEQNKANFSDGLAGKRDDDKGSYSHGSKELFFMHSIETRTHIAEFYLKDRQDGLGVQNQHGGIGKTDLSKVPASQRLKCLDRIVLYAKGDHASAKPELLKTVHFTYDYLLCQQTPNSLAPGKGKLTLKQLWFTYGLSNKGVLNPYKFEYADPDFDGVPEANFDYNSKDYDRWGNYKKQQPGVGNEAFPYTIQNKGLSDSFVGAYALTRIKTPTGGEMRVHYESDDYGFVQNKVAMRMFKIKGMSDNKHALGDNPETLYVDGEGLDGKLYLHVDLGEGFELGSGQNAVDYFKKYYLDDISELQYRAKIKVHANFSEELVTGYCLFDKSKVHVLDGVESNGKIRYTTAVLKLEPESINRKGKDIHPFVKNGWLYANLQYNRELMGTGEVNGNSSGFLQVVEAIAKSTQHILSFISGFKTYMRARNHGKTFISSESFVRLYEHDRIKLGGGHRVKAIVMLDRWQDMLSDREKNSSLFKELAGYGQVYDYTIPEDLANSNSRLISSGVAAYEPIIGGEENPWRRLVKTTERIPMAPDKEFYSETPYGESFFPAPSIGYRKVRTIPIKVTGSDYSLENLVSNGTGYVEHEFYTAYDFPTFVSETSLDPYRDASSQTNPLKIKSFDYVFCSQGYLIELNDMHGKAKSVKVMPDDPTGKAAPVSYVTYHYKVNANDPGRLDNHVPLVARNLSVSTTQGKQIGVTVDVVNDTRYYSSKTIGGGADINAKLSFSKPPFVVIPQITAFPDVNFERVDFSSITTTKVVNRYGILVKTIAHDNGQAVTSENLAWDEITGEILLTRVQNEFYSSIYNFTYPAHWAYHAEGMDMAFRNEGLRFTSLASVASKLRDGDEIVYKTGENSYEYAYLYKNGSEMKLLSKNGGQISSFSSAIVVRSGGRNLATTPVATISTLKNPLINNKLSFDAARILQAGATEYKFVWKGFCNCGEQNQANVNPFITGERGQSRPWKSWVYLTERVQTGLDGELNVREDGYYTDYEDFWRIGQEGLVPFYKLPGLTHLKWQFVTEIENYNPNGMEIENRDALNRYSMAQVGYARNLPVATSNNSRYQETGFDGFEDYIYGNCHDDHFSWRVRSKDTGYGLTESESHTGRQSFRVPAGGRSKIVKIIDPCTE